MTRVKILLACGNHGSNIGTVHTPPDKTFFSKAISPFLESEVVADRKVVILQEQNLTTELLSNHHTSEILLLLLSLKRAMEMAGRPGPPEEVFNSLISEVKQMEERVNRGYARTLNQGDGLDRYDCFGYEETAVRLIKTHPGAITFICESQSAATFWATVNAWVAENLPLSENEVILATNLIMTSSEMIYVRDMAVYNQIIDLARNGAQSIVLPRGALHIGMARFFDQDRFDVTTKPEDVEKLKRELSTGNPIVAACFERHLQGLTHERAEYYARLVLANG